MIIPTIDMHTCILSATKKSWPGKRKKKKRRIISIRINAFTNNIIYQYTNTLEYLSIDENLENLLLYWNDKQQLLVHAIVKYYRWTNNKVLTKMTKPQNDTHWHRSGVGTMAAVYPLVCNGSILKAVSLCLLGSFLYPFKFIIHDEKKRTEEKKKTDWLMLQYLTTS